MSAFDAWVEGLEARHLADLEFPEVSRALRALSTAYVERRARLSEGAALAGAGKRAAFALFYGPLHFLLIRRIVSALPGAHSIGGPIVDIGCGTGASGAAWADACVLKPAIVGVDRHRWARAEAAWTYRRWGLRARTLGADIGRGLPGARGGAFLLAFTANELTEAARGRVGAELIARGAEGHAILVVEPLAGFVAPWWDDWAARFEALGGRADEWRFRAELPAIVQKLDRAAGLDHREITGRSIWLAARRRRSTRQVHTPTAA